MKRVQQVRRGSPPHWVGDGFPVRTFFAYDEPAPFTPFLLLDYGGPAQFEPAEKPRGVGPHPHRGFETVTIVYQGEVEHRDSAGHGGRIGPGDVQWMTAASGIVHSEMHGDAFTRTGGMLEMVQLWVNLPARAKMGKPGYQDLTAAAIPTVALANGAGSVRVIAGSCLGARGRARTHTPIELWDVTLRGEQAAEFALPAGHTAMLLVQRGALRVGDERVAQHELALLTRDGDRVALRADGADARVLLLAGAPIDEPVAAYGPFVMNTEAELRQAFADYHAGRMGSLTE